MKDYLGDKYAQKIDNAFLSGDVDVKGTRDRSLDGKKPTVNKTNSESVQSSQEVPQQQKTQVGTPDASAFPIVNTTTSTGVQPSSAFKMFGGVGNTANSTGEKVFGSSGFNGGFGKTKPSAIDKRTKTGKATAGMNFNFGNFDTSSYEDIVNATKL